MKTEHRVCVRRLRELRDESRLNQTEFSRAMGISRPSLSAYESYQRIPETESIIEICKFCNVSADWLLGLSDVKHRNTSIDTQAASKKYGLSSDTLKTLAGYADGENERQKLLLRIINELIEHGGEFSEYLGRALYSPEKSETDRIKTDHYVFRAIESLTELRRRNKHERTRGTRRQTDV